MSVGITIELDIKNLSSRDQAGQVREAVQGVMEDEGIRRQVPAWTREVDGEFLVRARSDFPVMEEGQF
ncbi:hypothetical protein JGS22_002850 [Streptomyces sp. P38-E01]|uniref:Uncharacterized protein n=1 Tax=Streptomyces tardus TaxID=2780544 RepID=A0A949N456_9ACTN|nr:hypothetical protein [Streptomyces tardus]MBU7596602.1 hypothetical protein [Streptomyces tardus]